MSARSILPLLLLAAACTPDFDPASRITKLRVLDVRADPPELAPAGDASGAPDAADLGALVAHPAFVTDPAHEVTVVHLACTPEPGDPGATACTSLTALGDPRALFPAADLALACADPGRGRVGALTLAGVERCGATGCAPVEVALDPADPATSVALPAPRYLLPPELGEALAALPADAAQRTLGVEVVVLALALDAPASALAPAAASEDACAALAAFGARFGEAWDGTQHLATIKRLRVRGPDATDAPNVNPPVSGIALDGAALPALGAGVAVVSTREADVLPLFPSDPDALRQRYTRRDAAGAAIEEKLEDWAFSWFATAGELDDERTQAPDEANRCTPAPGRALLWVVARDLRGGSAWAAVELDASSP